jgi:hypothetical protein
MAAPTSQWAAILEQDLEPSSRWASRDKEADLLLLSCEDNSDDVVDDGDC